MTSIQINSAKQPGSTEKSNSEINREQLEELDLILRNRFKVDPVDEISFGSSKTFKEDPISQNNELELSTQERIQENLKEKTILELSSLLKKIQFDRSKTSSTASTRTQVSHPTSQNEVSSLEKHSNQSNSLNNLPFCVDAGYSTDTNSGDSNDSDPHSSRDEQNCFNTSLSTIMKARNGDKFVLKSLDIDVVILKTKSQYAADLLEHFTKIKPLMKDDSKTELINELKQLQDRERVHFILITGFGNREELESKCCQLLRFMSHFEKSKQRVKYIYALTVDSDSKLFEGFENLSTLIEQVESKLETWEISKQEQNFFKSQAVSLQLVDKYFKSLKAPLLMIDTSESLQISTSQELEQNSSHIKRMEKETSQVEEALKQEEEAMNAILRKYGF